MAQKIIDGYKGFEEYVGKELGLSSYLRITQEMVNKFADSTLDDQWIHTDPERAKKESPFKATIAHGYLTLSLLKYFWDDILEVKNAKAIINYGIDKFKFGSPVEVGSNVRIRVFLHSLKDLRGIAKMELKVTMEVENQAKPAFEGIIIFLYHFN